MILRAADGTAYKVHFRHWLPCKPVRVKGQGLCRAVNVYRSAGQSGLGLLFLQSYSQSPATSCYLHLEDCRCPWQLCNSHNILAMGIARCSPRDVFTKARGRRVALGRALKSLLGDDPLCLQLLASYERQLLPKCEHKSPLGNPTWLIYESQGFKICTLCNLRREL